MTLDEVVALHTRVTGTGKKLTSWSLVADTMNEIYDDDKSSEYYRYQWRKDYDEKYINSHTGGKNAVRLSISRLNKVEGITGDIDKILINELQKERTIDQLMYATKLSKTEVLGNIEQLRLDGYNIQVFRINDLVYYYADKTIKADYAEVQHYQKITDTFKIGFISDTHICSKFWQPTYLKMAYDDFEKEGVHSVYHVGDITDGYYKQREGQIYELYKIGYDEQRDEVVKIYPKKDGITTYLITGNHDATHIKNGGSNIGKGIADRRSDIVYLGHEYVKVWLTPKLDMDLVHPGDGSSYALSYQIQKRIDSLNSEFKPKIMVNGHYHKNFSMFYRNIWSFSLPSFIEQTPFMRSKALVSDIGYVILEVKINAEGDIIEAIPHFKMFTKPIKDDYLNY